MFNNSKRFFGIKDRSSRDRDLPFQIIGAERVRGKSGVCVYVARGWKGVKANTHTRPGLFLLTYTKKKKILFRTQLFS